MYFLETHMIEQKQELLNLVLHGDSLMKKRFVVTFGDYYCGKILANQSFLNIINAMNLREIQLALNWYRGEVNIDSVVISIKQELGI